ncbi:eukaryotic peptide chain release factor GTP-binding subunit ERF3A-like isoform X1 [Hermetia illucens]|uniref:eukaryotic peptide chain release factor GTP-binding subunit ERF3A-like isoform X1 n=1 Tax=Hermetia illucens TaxID=343691 RepID=UPI0018CC5DE5|nr:eukaryotic peptide chain release factor GTP-binding subunit ERF3A-like isoform X1 [Hermetia illucens]
MAHQDSNSSDFSAKFSTLNVNAMEFVPSFAYSGATAAAVAAVNTVPVNDTPAAAATADGDTAGGGDGVAPASSTPQSSLPSSQQTTPTAAVAPAVPPPPAAAADPPVQPAAPVTAPATVTASITPEDRSPQNNDDPVDSWDVDDEEPVASTPEDEDVGDIEMYGDNDEEITQKISKKKASKYEENHSKKEHVNVVFIGHVDAGKSTIGGQIMALTGMVDKRTLEKNQREAREKSRESWYLSWALDTNSEEREKGKTVEVGRAFFETERKHFTILDAPGHKSFVPNMIGGAAQADLAVLVISARKGEFETGFDRGGQTREHAMLAKTAGVKHLVVLVNKMDDPTVNWDELRYNECRDKILPYLKKLGFNPNKDLTFMPCSGLTGLGLRETIEETVCPWYRGLAFIPFIDQLPSLNRKLDGPFIMPIVDKYKDMGTVVMGKVESGCAKKGQNLLVMPNRTQVSVDQLFSDDDEVTSIAPGENVKIKLKGIEEEDVSPGFVLCDASNPIKIGKIFDAQVVILEHKSIICAGYSAVMHIHCAAEEITVKALICLVDKKTGEKSKTRPRFVKQDQVAIMRIECSGLICLEPFKLFPQMGRFTLRDENKTIAIGKVLKVIE